MQRSLIRGELLLALGIIALAAFVLWKTFDITVSPGYARVGPQAAPFVVAAGLALVGVVLLYQALTGRWRAEQATGGRPRALLIVMAGLIAIVLLLKPAGFVVASTALFVAVAQAFASTKPLRDAVIGAALSTTAYLFFTRILGLTLPAGWLWGT